MKSIIILIAIIISGCSITSFNSEWNKNIEGHYIFKQRNGYSMNIFWEPYKVEFPFDPRDHPEVCKSFIPQKNI